MNRLGLTDYNSVIKDIYDSNTIGPDGEEERIPSEKKESAPGESTLVKETLRLRNTAVLNLKLKQKIFKYEKQRLNQLRVDDFALGGSGGSVGATGVVPGAEGLAGGIGGGFKVPKIKGKPKPRRNPNRNKNRNKNKNRNRPKNRNRNRNPNRNRNRGRRPGVRGNPGVTRGRGGARSNPFRRFNPFKPKVTGRPSVPPGLNNPIKGLGNPFKGLRSKPNITGSGGGRIPKGLNNPLDAFRKGPNVTRSRPNVPPGLNNPARGLGLPKLGGPKVTKGGATRPFGIGPGGGPEITTGRGAPVKGGFQFKMPTVKGVVTGVKTLIVGWVLDTLVLAGADWAMDRVFGTEQEQAQRFAENFKKETPEKQAKIRANLERALETELNWQKSFGGMAQKAIALGDETISEVKSKKLKRLLSAIGAPQSDQPPVRQEPGPVPETRVAGEKYDPENPTTKQKQALELSEQMGNPPPGYKDGGVTENKPQLVIVGDGGEKEYIVPESKLSYFLGTSQAAKYLNYGISPLVTAAENYARAAGLKTDKIGELQDTVGLERENLKPPSGIRPIQSSFKDLGKTIFDYVKEGLMKLLKPFAFIAGVISSLNPFNFLFGGSPAAAATVTENDAIIQRMDVNRNITAPTAPLSGIDPGKLSGDTFATGLRTAPKGYMGSGDEYHIDTKFSKSLSLEQRVDMMDQLAASYAERGRQIEFSNQAVSGRQWDMNAPMEEKIALLQAAQSAHSHSIHSDYDSIDYYIPSMGENRFQKSAEGAEILVPTVEGGKVNYGQGGGYGAYVTVTDENGNVLVKTGHGDVRDAKTGSVDIPVKPTINKDSEVEQDPMEDIQVDLPQIALPQPQVVTQYLPLTIPMYQRGNSSGSNNTPAWGNNSLIGG